MKQRNLDNSCNACNQNCKSKKSSTKMFSSQNVHKKFFSSLSTKMLGESSSQQNTQGDFKYVETHDVLLANICFTPSRSLRFMVRKNLQTRTLVPLTTKNMDDWIDEISEVCEVFSFDHGVLNSYFMIEMLLNLVQWLQHPFYSNTTFWSLNSKLIKITPLVKTFESIHAYDEHFNAS